MPKPLQIWQSWNMLVSNMKRDHAAWLFSQLLWGAFMFEDLLAPLLIGLLTSHVEISSGWMCDMWPTLPFNLHFLIEAAILRAAVNYLQACFLLSVTF